MIAVEANIDFNVSNLFLPRLYVDKAQSPRLLSLFWSTHTKIFEGYVPLFTIFYLPMMVFV